jgi:hypothetical protein
MKRFFYVARPLGKVKHIMYGKSHSEGLTACGLYVSKGWLWWTASRSPLPRCKNCENAN